MGEEGRSSNLLPPGFRFLPSDEELVVHFLYRKAARLPCNPDIIPTLDRRCLDPWDLDGKALQSGNNWYFFSPKMGSGASANGYWSSISVDESIPSGGGIVGLKKTLVFYFGEAPQGIKTNWVMQEYHLLNDAADMISNSSSSRRSSSRKRTHQRTELDKWVVCRVYEASCGPQAGFCDNTAELSCMDEIFWSLDDFDEISLPN